MNICIDVVPLYDNTNRAIIRGEFVRGASGVEEHEYLMLISFPISTSSMVYSTALIAAKEVVNDTLLRSLPQIVVDCLATRFSLYDCDGGSLFGAENQQIYPFEILAAIADTRIFEHIELGCCSTYSHRSLKTRCLTCLVFAEVEGKYISSFVDNILRILTENYPQLAA